MLRPYKDQKLYIRSEDDYIPAVVLRSVNPRQVIVESLGKHTYFFQKGTTAWKELGSKRTLSERKPLCP